MIRARWASSSQVPIAAPPEPANLACEPLRRRDVDHPHLVGGQVVDRPPQIEVAVHPSVSREVVRQ